MSELDTGTPAPGSAADTVRHRRPDRWVILAAVCLAQIVVLLDNTVLNLAIPELNRDLGASTADIQWMINAYALVQSGLLLIAGTTADRYGRKRALLVGLTLFGTGSLFAALANSPAQVIAARAGMGVGGALIMTTTLAVIMHTFDDDERPMAIGIWGAVSSVGFAGGPVLGGVLLSHFWWGSIFLINVPVALISALVAAKLIPEIKHPAGRPDFVGALLSIVGMTGVVYAIIGGPGDGWTSGIVLGAAAIGIVGLIAFVLWELHVDDPMLDMSFFANARFNGAIAGGLLVAFGMAGSLFLLTQQLQLVLNYSPLEAGLRTVPLAGIIVVLNLRGVSVKVLKRIGSAATIALGMTALAVGLCLLAVLGRPGNSYLGILVGLLVMGTGISLAMPAMVNAIMSSIPVEKAGVGAGVQGTLTEFGGGIGVAVLGAVLSAQFIARQPDLGGSKPGSLADALASVTDADTIVRIHNAFADGVQISQLVGATAVFAGGLLAGFLLHRANSRATGAPAPATDRDPALVD